ncbi:MAG UNVERIFIED_CONTAM: hypothetical protein LVQ98_00190 [Rickettsiaceae bacterium]
MATADTALVKALAIDGGSSLALNGDVLSGDAGNGGAQNYDRYYFRQLAQLLALANSKC